MIIRRIWVDNYRDFRRTFEDDTEAKMVLDNLENKALGRLLSDTDPSISLFFAPSYDDDGVALFEVRQVKVLPDRTVIINVEFTGTAK